MILAVFAFTSVNAQYKVKDKDTYKAFNGKAGDTLSVSDDGSCVELSKTIFVDKTAEYNYFIEVDVDSLGSADGGVTTILKGSYSGRNYYNIDTATWSQSSADTILTFSSYDDALVRYRYLQLYFKSDSTDVNMQLSTSDYPIRIQVYKE